MSIQQHKEWNRLHKYEMEAYCIICYIIKKEKYLNLKHLLVTRQTHGPNKINLSTLLPEHSMKSNKRQIDIIE